MNVEIVEGNIKTWLFSFEGDPVRDFLEYEESDIVLILKMLESDGRSTAYATTAQTARGKMTKIVEIGGFPDNIESNYSNTFELLKRLECSSVLIGIPADSYFERTFGV